MKLDRKLNIVVPLETSAGDIYVHSTPISRQIFERYYKPIARAYAAMFSEKFTVYSSPKIAKLLLKDAAQELGMWDGADGVEKGLLPEIRRLTNVIMPGQNGWQTVPFDGAKMLDEDDVAEVENILVFFTCISAVAPKSDLKTMLGMTSVIWKTQDTSLNCTDFASSLPTSTETENTGATEILSSIPH
jgi:hypothetical protein